MTDIRQRLRAALSLTNDDTYDDAVIEALTPAVMDLIREAQISALREAAYGWLAYGSRYGEGHTAPYKYLQDRADKLTS